MKQLLQFVTLCALLLSCSSNDYGDQWSRFMAMGIPQTEETYNELLFTDSATGYLGGERMITLGEVDGRYRFADRTVLYKTADQGRSWSTLPLNYKGSVDRIFSFGDTLLVLLQNIGTDSIRLLRSDNVGRQWQALFSTSSESIARDIHFVHTGLGYMIVDNRHTQHLLRYEGSTWDTVLALPGAYSRHRIFNDKVMSLVPRPHTATSTAIVVTDIPTRRSRQILFDRPYYIADLHRQDNRLLLAASHKDSGCILAVSGDSVRVINLGKYAPYEPSKVFARGDTIMAIANRQKDAAFLGVIHHLLVSYNNGRNWALEELPDAMYIEAPTLTRAGFFMSYCGMGHFQLRQ